MLHCKEARCRRYQQRLNSTRHRLFLPALSYRPFPLEGFDFVGPLTSLGFEPGFFLCQCSKAIEAF
jgi:hypothetical protein